MASFVPLIKEMSFRFPKCSNNTSVFLFLTQIKCPANKRWKKKNSAYGIVSFIQRYMRNRTLTPIILQNVESASPLVQNITNQCHFGEWALFVFWLVLRVMKCIFEVWLEQYQDESNANWKPVCPPWPWPITKKMQFSSSNHSLSAWCPSDLLDYKF